MRYTSLRDLARFQKAPRLCQRPASRPRTVTNNVSHHRRTIATVFLINVLDHFFAPIMLDVEIDVRRLARSPLK